MQTKMRRVFALILLFAVVAGFALLLSSCNQTILGTVGFMWGVIRMPDGDLVAGNVDSWKPLAESGLIQVKINGITYMTHASNVVLCSEKP